MIPSGEIRNGMAIREDRVIYLVTECQQVKPGKGTAFARTRLKNIRTGAVLERTYKSADKVEDIRVERREAQYQYSDGTILYVMDMISFEQIAVPAALLADGLGFLKDNTTVSLMTTEEGVIGAEMPNFVNLEVVETDPGVRGDTATGGTKPARLESGGTVQVPLFVNTGDVLKVDTRTKTYVERV